MSRWFKKKGDKERGGKPVDRKPPTYSEQHVSSTSPHRRQSSSSLEGKDDINRSSPSSNELIPPLNRPGSISPIYTSNTSIYNSYTTSSTGNIDREVSQTSVRSKTELYESLSKSNTPEHYSSLSRGSFSKEGRYPRSGSSSQGTTPTHRLMSQTSPTKDYMYLHDVSGEQLVAKEFKGIDLPLPPLITSSVKHRDVVAVKSPLFGGFGFNLRKSFQPDPNNSDNTLLVHLVEPRPSYIGPLMSGDRILQVNRENVETCPHERVVELIRLSGDRVQFRVASVPELIELNERGVFDETRTYSTAQSKKGVKAGAGTLRKKAAQNRQPINFQARSEDQVAARKSILTQGRNWLIHKDGFTLVSLENDKSSDLSTHVSFLRSQGCKVRVHDTDELIDVEETDLEKINPPELDRVEDIINLVHLNESSVLHVLRQRYGSSLIHTFAGHHIIIINPLRHLSLYSDRVIEMFRGCRREDMPPHIFASGQQAYQNMMSTNNDQSLVLTGLSGSGKTFNARYLLRYLATIGHSENSLITSGKLDAVQLLLHAFTSAGTFLNPQATRCSSLYSLEFDSSGSLMAASTRIFLLEKTRVAMRTEGELNFNIFYQLLAGVANDPTLQKELLLNTDPGTDEPNTYIQPYTDSQQIESAAIVWDLILNCLNILNISNEEAYGIWSILAAIYHLGYAGVKQGSGRVTERFINPSAAMRAATLLGIPHEELSKDIFNPPRVTTASTRSSTLSSSPSVSETSSINMSINSFNISPTTARNNRSYSLDAFVMGLYDNVINCLILLINRALQPNNIASTGGHYKRKHLIHVLDTPGFQNRELADCKEPSSFDELCMNYTRERLQMLFHDFVFTAVQDRYLQEDVDWLFSELVISPLSVIDVIDKHVPQRRGPAFQGLDLNEKRGLLWLLEEESTYPGSTDMTFLEKVNSVHSESDDLGEPVIKVNIDKGQFIITHCQRTQPIVYDVTGWRIRVREHPSTRVVSTILPESKNHCISSLYHNISHTASTSAASNTIQATHSRLSRHASFSNPTAGIKKSSLCLKTKFQLDFLIDVLRKTTQWYIICVLCQRPVHLPGALLPPNNNNNDNDDETHPLPVQQGHIDVPLVRSQLRQADIISAARIYKQGYPEHQFYSSFRRRYSSLLSQEEKQCLPVNDRDAVEFILSGLELDKSSYKLGLSQVFFRAGIVSSLDRQVEEKTHDIMVVLQSYGRGWLGRRQREKLELQHAAAHVIQRNIIEHEILRDWDWWKLLQKVKPLLAVWKVEETVKEKESEISTLKGKLTNIEEERNVLRETETRLINKVNQLTQQLMESQETATHATDLLEQEQIERRQLQEQNQDVTSTEHELIKRNEELQLQVAELSILARIKQSEDNSQGDTTATDNSEAVLEKYWETKRELETLRQRISTEHEDEIERLKHAKKTLEKRLADSDAEIEDLRRNLTQVRKKATKFSSELNDMKLLLETQQTRNEDLEKKQRKFDSDLNNVKTECSEEKQSKDKLEREKNMLTIEHTSLQEKYKKLQEDFQQLENEKTEIETELLKKSTTDADTEISSYKRMKRELESKVEELEDEVDDLNIKVDSLQQTKSRLELGQQTLKTQHQRELEGRDDDLEQMKNTMNKKLKTVEQQLEEEHEQKQQAIKAKRELEREVSELKAKGSIDPEIEKKLKKQVKKYKALLVDAQEELEHERETRSNAGTVRALRSQLEDMELRESTAIKSQKRLQSEYDDLQTQYDELTRIKLEMETHLNDVSREKTEFEQRLEEESEEVEQLTIKLRTSITQVGSLQQSLNETNFQLEEIENNKQTLESKVIKLQERINELESDSNKQEFEATEVKIRELEQKLELERSTIKRQETTINRLRSQLERAQTEKVEESSSKSSDVIKRFQKQLREVREELQESERKEQEGNKKRRALESELNEKDTLIQTIQSDLKSAHKRIESLQEALDEGQGDEYSSIDELEQTSPNNSRHSNKKTSNKVKKQEEEEEEVEYSNDSLHSDSDDDDDLKIMNTRRKTRQEEKTRQDESNDDINDDDEDIDDFLAKLKSKRKAATELQDDDYTITSKPSRYSDDDIDSAPVVKKKTDWRALLSSSDDDKPVNKRKDSDSDNTLKRTTTTTSTAASKTIKTRKAWESSSDSDNDIITKRISTRTNKTTATYTDSDNDKHITSKPKHTYSSSDEKTSKPMRSEDKTAVKHYSSSEDDTKDVKKEVKWSGGIKELQGEKEVDKSFQTSRQRRARRRSRGGLSNNEDSPKRTQY